VKLWKKISRIRLPKIPIRPWLRAHRGALLRTGRIALYSAIPALIVLLVHREVYSLVIGKKEYSVESDSLRVSLAPSWAKGKHTYPVDPGGEPWNAFDGGAAERVGHAFERNPWVRCVTSVERLFPNRVKVKFEYRVPHAAVRTAEGWIAIDEQRVRLPGVWTERPPCALRADLVGLVGAPAPGEVWDSPALAAGLGLAELVESEPTLAKAEVQAVDVSNVDGRLDPRKSELAMLTGGGCILYWGRPCGTKKFGERTVIEKIENLKRVLQEYPHLDGLQYVKLFFKRPTVLEKDSRTTGR